MKKLTSFFLSLVLLGSFCLGFATPAQAGTLSGLSKLCESGFVEHSAYAQCRSPKSGWEQACTDLGGGYSIGLDHRTAYCDL